MSTLPVAAADFRRPARTTVQPSPSLLAAAAVMRTWFDWLPPPVTRVSQP